MHRLGTFRAGNGVSVASAIEEASKREPERLGKILEDIGMTTSNGTTSMTLRQEPAPLAKTEAANPIGALEPRNFDEGMRLAQVVVKAGMFGVKNEADAFMRIATGMGLGLSAYQSLRGIFVINGKPGISADLMHALCLQSPDCEHFEQVSTSPTKATFSAKRKGGKRTELSFTIEEAKQAGLLNNPQYAKYPARMLEARCKAALARLVFPERMHGLYTPEELGSGGGREEQIVYAEHAATESTRSPNMAEVYEQPAEEVEPEPTGPSADQLKTAAEFELSLRNAKTRDEIKTVSAMIGKARLPEAILGQLRKVKESQLATIEAEKGAA